MGPNEQLEPLLVSASDAAKMIGVGKSLFYQLVSDGRLGPEPVELGKKLYSLSELQSWVDAKCPARSEWIEIQKAQKCS